MALAGVHITCACTATPVFSPSTPALLSQLLWSQTMASPGTTALAAPAIPQSYGPVVFEVTAAAAVYACYGAAPNATSGPRVYIGAGVTQDFIVQPGDKLAWILVP